MSQERFARSIAMVQRCECF